MREMAPGVRVLEASDYRRMHWKNGRGWTTEIAVSPADAGLNGKPFDWRISLADIENDGNFSSFPGYDRTILLAKGEGMELSFDAAPMQRLAECYAPFSFKGEWRTRCRLLDGPVRDFNVMSARAAYRHQCEILRNASCTLLAATEVAAVLVYCFQGEASVLMEDQKEYEFSSDEALYLSTPQIQQRPQIIALGAKTVLAIVTFTHRVEARTDA